MRPLLLAALAAAFVIAPPAAHASVLPGSCPTDGIGQPFLPWLDGMSYVPAPDGGLEAGGAGWTLRGGAAVVPGNETFQVGSAGDSRSLSLPAGASATTAPSCRGLDRPTLRFFARRTGGSPLSALRVDALAGGAAVTLGTVTAGASWQPTLPLPIALNLLPAGDGTIAYRFTAAGGAFAVDDVYVDPYGKY